MFNNSEELDECQVCIRAGVSLVIPVKNIIQNSII